NVLNIEIKYFLLLFLLFIMVSKFSNFPYNNEPEITRLDYTLRMKTNFGTTDQIKLLKECLHIIPLYILEKLWNLFAHELPIDSNFTIIFNVIESKDTCIVQHTTEFVLIQLEKFNN